MQLRSMLYFAASAAVFTGCGVTDDLEGDAPAPVVGALTLAQHQAICDADPRVQAGVVSLDVCVGADIFFRETFNGNGRTCATCHRVERNFTIDPAFIATLPAQRSAVRRRVQPGARRTWSARRRCGRAA